MNKHSSIHPRGGMSLVELVTALAIIALGATLLVTAYSGATNIMRRGMARQRGADSAYAALAVGEGTQTPAAAKLEIGGRTYTVPGTVVESRDSGTGVVFHAFIPRGGPP